MTQVEFLTFQPFSVICLHKESVSHSQLNATLFCVFFPTVFCLHFRCVCCALCRRGLGRRGVARVGAGRRVRRGAVRTRRRVHAHPRRGLRVSLPRGQNWPHLRPRWVMWRGFGDRVLTLWSLKLHNFSRPVVEKGVV